MRGACFALALVLSCCACGRAEPLLEGSLSEVVGLKYRTADVTQSQDELALRFVMPQGISENVVLRLTVSTLGTTIEANAPWNLAEEDPLGRQRGSVSRNVIEDPLERFPEIERGELVFERPLQFGARVPGSFHVTFVQGTELASGRTVFGTFEAKVQ